MESRNIIDFDTINTKKSIFDVVVVGSGIAGLFTALNIDAKYKVAMISKRKLDENNSNLAQGGIAACVYPQDDFISHYRDTLKAGAYYNVEESTKILIEEASLNIEKLLNYGVNFDRDENGSLKVTREGGHSKNRILHAKDATGREVIRALEQEIHKRKNIVLLEDVFAVDISIEKGTAAGILAIDKNGKKITYRSKAVVLATGGVGQLFKNTTNASIATGDGIAMAYRAGANIIDMEFIQFHPTAMYNEKPGQKFLISEAVRGEGAILRNINGEAFMEKYHEMRDLAPRDIVARSIFTEMIKADSPCVYLDITHKSSDFITNRFPMIYERCLKEGIDMTKEWIPVAPAEHYIMGGIFTNINGETNIKGLYACGECACTGVHGANRLASNSLLEGIVFGNRAANSINNRIQEVKINRLRMKSLSEDEKNDQNNKDIDYESLKQKLENIMDKYVSIVRSEKGLKDGLEQIEEIRKSLYGKNIRNVQVYELINMCTVAVLIIKGALGRRESLGAHYRVE